MDGGYEEEKEQMSNLLGKPAMTHRDRLQQMSISLSARQRDEYEASWQNDKDDIPWLSGLLSPQSNATLSPRFAPRMSDADLVPPIVRQEINKMKSQNNDNINNNISQTETEKLQREKIESLEKMGKQWKTDVHTWKTKYDNLKHKYDETHDKYKEYQTQSAELYRELSQHKESFYEQWVARRLVLFCVFFFGFCFYVCCLVWVD